MRNVLSRCTRECLEFGLSGLRFGMKGVDETKLYCNFMCVGDRDADERRSGLNSGSAMMRQLYLRNRTKALE